MSLRVIRKDGDEILRKRSKEVKELNEKTIELIKDMKETMNKEGGCGLASPQVGILKRIIIVKPDEEKDEIFTFINPQITKSSEEMIESFEGCLSIPGMSGEVSRPKNITVKAYNEQMVQFEQEYEDFFARIILHEVDHLDGILYKDRCKKGLIKNEDLEKDEK
ncbi:MAG: peptide deformylase [Eubacteriales bacterium]|nr:peptide deformylase [Eubacteriales bacterium]